MTSSQQEIVAQTCEL